MNQSFSVLLGIRASKVRALIGARAVHYVSTRSKAYFLAKSMVEPFNGTWMIRSTP